MRTIFVTEPFRRFELGWAPSAAGLAQAPSPKERAFPVVEEILEEVGIKEEDIVKLLDKVPENLSEQYKARLEECKKMGATTVKGAKCLYDLFQEVKRSLKEGEERPGPRPTPVARVEAPTPWWPFVVGGLAAAGLIVFLATRGS